MAYRTINIKALIAPLKHDIELLPAILPPDPEKAGHHWLEHTDGRVILFWWHGAPYLWWYAPSTQFPADLAASEGWTYHSALITPAPKRQPDDALWTAVQEFGKR